MPSQEKSKAERLSETITLLKKLQDVGVGKTDPGYEQIKTIMSTWVQDGEPVQTTVDLGRMERRAHILLPRIAGRSANITLKEIP